MKTDATLFYWQDTPGGVLLRHDIQEHDYMCTGVMLAAQVLQGGQAIVVARTDAEATVDELWQRGVPVAWVERVDAAVPA